jgi:hypothetical protein
MAVKNTKFSGMKQSPYVNSPKNAIRDKSKSKKRKKKVGNGSVTSKKGLSAYQLRTQEQFMKVRPGETKEQWLFRTRFRRVRSEDEVALTQNGRKRIEKMELTRNRQFKKRVQFRIAEKNFNFLKYYVFIINWASIKFDIPQTDLEIGFHFYENIHFTKSEFANKSLLIGNTTTAAFNRFKKEGYLEEHFSTMGIGTDKKSTGYYRLTSRFIKVLTKIYDKIAYQSHFDFRPTIERKIPPEVEAMIMEMSAENQDIISGQREPDSFIIHKEERK